MQKIEPKLEKNESVPQMTKLVSFNLPADFKWQHIAKVAGVDPPMIAVFPHDYKFLDRQTQHIPDISKFISGQAGTWHDTHSHPIIFSPEACAPHEFILDKNFLERHSVILKMNYVEDGK